MLQPLQSSHLCIVSSNIWFDTASCYWVRTVLVDCEVAIVIRNIDDGLIKAEVYMFMQCK
jgi:hypothetical protein